MGCLTHLSAATDPAQRYDQYEYPASSSLQLFRLALRRRGVESLLNFVTATSRISRPCVELFLLNESRVILLSTRLCESIKKTSLLLSATKSLLLNATRQGLGSSLPESGELD